MSPRPVPLLVRALNDAAKKDPKLPLQVAALLREAASELDRLAKEVNWSRGHP